MRSIDSIRQHFIDRLHERHGLVISHGDYAILNKRKPSVLFKKSQNKKIVRLQVGDRMVPALHDSDYNLLVTCYPADVLTDEVSFLRACFSAKIHPVAVMIRQHFLAEVAAVKPTEFKDDKAAALAFNQQCAFPSLLMSIYKNGSYPLAHLAKVIQNIINGQDNSCQLTLRSLELEERKARLQGKIDHRQATGCSAAGTRPLQGKLRTMSY